MNPEKKGFVKGLENSPTVFDGSQLELRNVFDEVKRVVGVPRIISCYRSTICKSIKILFHYLLTSRRITRYSDSLLVLCAAYRVTV